MTEGTGLGCIHAISPGGKRKEKSREFPGQPPGDGKAGARAKATW